MGKSHERAENASKLSAEVSLMTASKIASLLHTFPFHFCSNSHKFSVAWLYHHDEQPLSFHWVAPFIQTNLTKLYAQKNIHTAHTKLHFFFFLIFYFLNYCHGMQCAFTENGELTCYVAILYAQLGFTVIVTTEQKRNPSITLLTLTFRKMLAFRKKEMEERGRVIN